jgi:hypothetical protein
VSRLVVLVCAAVMATMLGAADEDTATRWHRTLVENQRRVQAAEWEAAYPVARDLVSELVAALKGGGAGRQLLAAAYCQRALAEAGLGRMEDAVWSFVIAQNLNPDFRVTPLAAFGAAGEALEGHRLPDSHGGVLDLERLELVPPLVVESPTIVFRAAPEILALFDRTMTVEVVIGPEGRPRDPIVRGVLDNPSPVALSLEALRAWRFEPAHLEGRAVACRVTLALPLTRGAAERARRDLTVLHAERTASDVP